MLIFCEAFPPFLILKETLSNRECTLQNLVRLIKTPLYSYTTKFFFCQHFSNIFPSFPSFPEFSRVFLLSRVSRVFSIVLLSFSCLCFYTHHSPCILTPHRPGELPTEADTPLTQQKTLAYCVAAIAWVSCPMAPAKASRLGLLPKTAFRLLMAFSSSSCCGLPGVRAAKWLEA